jgi:hypothetical protein
MPLILSNDYQVPLEVIVKMSRKIELGAGLAEWVVRDYY